MSRRYDRRELFAAGLGLLLVPRRGARAERTGGQDLVDDLPEVGAWAERALAALARPTVGFGPSGAGAACDLGAEGRLEVTPDGDAAVRVALVGCLGELEILRALDSTRVARVEARLPAPAAPPVGPCYDTLRRVPGGFELTFSSALALRHVEPKRIAGEPPVVYERLAAAAVDGARPFLC